MGLEKYSVGKMLGKGSFGKALIVTDKADGAKYVMKEIDISKMPKQEKDAALQEAQLLKALKHPNIVSSKETFIEKGKLCIVMDYCDQGDLYMQLQKRRGVLLDEEQILDWTVQMCLGLKHVHDRKILHRDLKSQNVFMSKGGLLKLGDFGVSKILNSTHHLATTAVGTPYYLSPEICQNKKYNQKSDIWSLGCLLYEITSLKHAFEAGSLKLLIHKIIRGQYPPLSSRYSQELRSLIDKMITKNPEKRPTINQILAEPIIKNRIKNFLSATLREDEFSHTIIHARKKPGELVPGAAGPVASIQQSRPANAGIKPGLPSQAAPGGGRVAVVASNPSRAQVAHRQPGPRAPAAGQLPPSSAASDQRRLQDAKAAQEKRAKEAREKELAAKKAREERQQAMLKEREEHNRRLEEERKRLEDQRQQMEQERRAQHQRAQAAAEADRARRAAEAEERRKEEAERLRKRAEDLRIRQEQERLAKAEAQKAEKERKEAERRREKERADQARKEFIARQREAARNREQVEGEVEVRMPGHGRRNAPKPEWRDVTVPDLDEAFRQESQPVGVSGAGGGGYAGREPVGAPSQTELDAAARRRVWEENQAAARRNRAQLEGDPDPSHVQDRPRRGRWDERPDLAHLPLSERRRIRLEEDARKREEELRDFQQRNWQEMHAAAKRNMQQLRGGNSATNDSPGGDGSQDVDDTDVQDQAAMCAEMARVYNNSVYSDGAMEEDGRHGYESEEFEDESDDDDPAESKEELRKSLSRFMLNGVEIDLGLTEDDSMPARVEALRIYLEEHLGFDAFVRVYQLMEGVSQDDDENEIMEAIFGTLGVEKMPYLQLIHQLIICEESMHQGRV